MAKYLETLAAPNQAEPYQIRDKEAARKTDLDGLQPRGDYALKTDLANYFLKSETYSREEVQQLLSAIPKFTIQVVDALPTENISDSTVYLLASGEDENLYTEYIYVNGVWEVLGSQHMAIVQPDWNQNDPEAADYVKNRTHYSSVKSIEWDGDITGKVVVNKPDSAVRYVKVSSDAYSIDDFMSNSMNEESLAGYIESAGVVNGEPHYAKVRLFFVPILEDGSFYEPSGSFYYIATPGDTINGMTFPEAGAYFSNNTSTEEGKEVYLYTQKVTGIPIYNCLHEKFLPTTVPVIPTATVGQTIVVKAVDENGKPTEWEAAEMPEAPVMDDFVTKDALNAIEFAFAKDANGHIDTLIITDGTIPENAFEENLKVVDISLPQTLTRIGYKAFLGCKNLALTALPDSVTTIESQAFAGCTNLALTALPDGVTTISDSVFSNCTNLALTALPDGVTTMAYGAFYKCTNLALTSLPEGITSIPGSAFKQCTNLALTSLPSNITEIGNGAFQACSNIVLTELPESLATIDAYAFQDCESITDIIMPENLYSIASSAFNSCGKLASVTFKGTPTSIGATAFFSCTNLTTINVPWAEGAVADAPWGATNATINYNYTGE